MTALLHIGVDFDNTIAGYDHVFTELAREWGLVPETFAGTKSELREKIQSLVDGHKEWMRLQGQVYGRQMSRAVLIDGVSEFLRSCREQEIPLSIISHKTETPHFDPEINLRCAAMDWMTENGFFDRNGLAFSRENIYFEPTRDRKVGRIVTTGCSHFVDDLIEIFGHPAFPSDVKGYLLSMDQGDKCSRSVTVCNSWQEVSSAIFN